MWLDGVQEWSQASVVNPFAGDHTGQELRVGRAYWGNDTFKGNMDQIVISNVARAGVEPIFRLPKPSIFLIR